ncbi:hypothetical protein ACMFMG_002326 [Clarireedia jacksonii]
MSSISFLDLPGEIRNQIYNDLLILPHIFTPRRLGSDPPIYPQILRVCKQVHEEAKQILYGGNVFIAHPNLLDGWPRLRWKYDTISSQNVISYIRRYYLIVRLDCDPNFTAENAERAFSGIEELTIRVEQAEFRGSDYQVLKLFEGVRGVKKTRVYGSVTGFPKYCQWLQNAMSTPKEVEVTEFEKFDAGGMMKLWNDFGR